MQHDTLTHYRQHATPHPVVPGGGTVAIPGKWCDWCQLYQHKTAHVSYQYYHIYSFLLDYSWTFVLRSIRTTMCKKYWPVSSISRQHYFLTLCQSTASYRQRLRGRWQVFSWCDRGKLTSKGRSKREDHSATCLPLQLPRAATEWTSILQILLHACTWGLFQATSSILLSRLIPYVKEIIGDHQCGFRRNRSTIDHIFCIRQILEKKWEYSEPVHQLFIDFKKAYDSVRREVLYKILIEFGIPRKLVRLIKMSLTETYSRVRVGKNVSDRFPIRNGLKQGDLQWHTVVKLHTVNKPLAMHIQLISLLKVKKQDIFL